MRTIVLADDHPVVLYGLERFLREAGDFNIIASCQDGSAALPIIRQKNPDLAVLDADMPGLSGCEVLAVVRSDALSTRVVFLSDTATDGEVAEAVRNGAWGVISKTCTSSEMVDHLRRVAAGDRWFARCDLEPASYVAATNRRDCRSKGATTLTRREREIAALVAAGMSNKEIAQRIAVCVGTVKIHLSNIFQKLNLNNRTSLAAVALQELLRSAPAGSSRADSAHIEA